jgi:surface protein
VYTGTVSSTPVLVESASTPFIATYNTALTAWWAPDDIHLALPLIDTGTYNMVVNWGDGSSDTITAYNQPAATHTYAAVGIYEVTITGVCNGWSYNQWGDGSKLTDVKQWGSDFRLGNTGNNFDGCGNMVITATDVLNMTGTTNLYAMFKDCAKLDRLPNFDTSLVTKMSYLLSGCTIFNASIAVLDTSSATDMKGMFRYCNAFNQPISTLDTSSAIDMSGMFEQCFVFNQPVSTLNLTGTINVYSMFENCYAFNQPVSSWDTSSATSFFGMFYNCGFFNRSLATFDVTKAVSLSSMLTGCANYSRANYDALLISWASQSDITGLKAGAYFGAGTVKYSAGAAAAARANIINTNSWTITDGGQF